MGSDKRTIIHVDMDAFYASVEQLDEPAFAGKPVIVGADPEAGRGVVSACSYEARRFGVHSAMPIVQAKRLCPDGVFLRPRMARYSELSRIIFGVFHNFTDLVEPLSVDEAFLDVTGSHLLFGDGVQTGQKIKAAVKEVSGLNCSVGIAPNKFAAKIASDLEKPDGLVCVTAENLLEFLHPLTVSKLWGVGAKTALILAQRRIRTIGDVAALTERGIKSILGDHGEHLRQLALGIDDRPVKVERETKSIGNEVTFDHDTGNEERIRRTLLSLSDKVAGRLRKAGLETAGVTLKFRDSSFKTVTRSTMLERPTALTDDIYREALTLLGRTDFRPGVMVRLIGVTASKLVESGQPRQGDLFMESKGAQRELAQKAEKAVDDIRTRFGVGMVRRGALVGAGNGKKSDK